MIIVDAERRQDPHLRFLMAGLSRDAVAIFLELRFLFPDGYFKLTREEMLERLHKMNEAQLRWHLGELHRRGLIRENRADGTYISPFVIRENMKAS